LANDYLFYKNTVFIISPSLQCLYNIVTNVHEVEST